MRSVSGNLEWWLLSLAITLVFTNTMAAAACTSQQQKQQEKGSLRIDENNNGVKVESFLSPRFELEPGSACNKFFFNVEFPKGHIALRGFDAELVDEEGNSIPLYETYLHHWLMAKIKTPKGVKPGNQTSIMVGNAGVCDKLPQNFGLGSETRKTDTHVPEPYGIEAGNPAPGFEEGWLLNIHAIDTRGAEDKMGCTECRCDLFNVTAAEIFGYYPGGMLCCLEGMRCRLKQGFQGHKRGLHLKYTVTYVDWSPSIVPVNVYIIDVTDTLKWSDSAPGKHACMTEYRIDACSADAPIDECVHSKSLTVSFPKGGDLIYASAHQHSGGLGSTLLGEDGRVLCNSFPIYGNGTEPGNEDGYIVGMTSCYPQPGSLKIAPNEKLTIISNYSNVQMHTGIMGNFYILVAEPEPPLPESKPSIIRSPLDMAYLV